MHAQRLGDELRFTPRKEVVHGADRCSAARDKLFDPRASEAPFAEQCFGSGEHSLATRGKARLRHPSDYIDRSRYNARAFT